MEDEWDVDFDHSQDEGVVELDSSVSVSQSSILLGASATQSTSDHSAETSDSKTTTGKLRKVTLLHCKNVLQFIQVFSLRQKRILV